MSRAVSKPAAAVLAGWLSVLALPAASHADAPPAAPPQAAGVLGDILRDNGRFVTAHDGHYFAPFRDEQHPRATVVLCADSRVHTQALDETPDGDLFVVRNIGNQIEVNEGSVAYGILHLHTPLLLIVGHVHCGAVKAAMGNYSEEPPSIRRELNGLHLSIAAAPVKHTAEEQWLADVESNVHQQVRNALREYASEVQSGHLAVVGAVYDFRDDLHQGAGRLVVIDVNGERDPSRMAASPLLRAALARPK